MTVSSKISPVGGSEPEPLEELLDLVQPIGLHGQGVARSKVVEVGHLLVHHHLQLLSGVGETACDDDRPIHRDEGLRLIAAERAHVPELLGMGSTLLVHGHEQEVVAALGHLHARGWP